MCRSLSVTVYLFNLVDTIFVYWDFSLSFLQLSLQPLLSGILPCFLFHSLFRVSVYFSPSRTDCTHLFLPCSRYHSSFLV